MLNYYLLQLLAVLLALMAVVYLFFKWKVYKQLKKWLKNLSWQAWTAILVILGAGVLNFFAAHPHPINFAMPPMMQSKAPGGLPASLPLDLTMKFFGQYSQFERIDDIGADPTAVPEPINRPGGEEVKIDIVTKEVLSEIGDDITFNYWTYNDQVPGPLFRVKEGDTVEISITNHESSLHPHNIDLHSVTGPGGGAAVSQVKPGETKTFRWKAINPGLYVYHCATANISTHNAHGQYGMILVEPKEGLPPVDKEFYVMQGELYTAGGIGKKGLVAFDSQALLDGIPTYVTFNGRLEDAPRMRANVGDKVRMYVGNGGLNLISSFHVIGEIFDKVYPEAAIGSEVHKNVQTTAVLPGGASIVEFTVDVPGNYILVDHALARMNKGAWAVLEVKGKENPAIYESLDK